VVVDASLVVTGAALVVLAIATGTGPKLWLPGAVLGLVGVVRTAMFVRGVVALSRSPRFLAAHENKIARWAQIQPAVLRDPTVGIRSRGARRTGVVLSLPAALFFLIAVACVTPPAAISGVVLGTSLGTMTLVLAWRLARVAVVGTADSLVVRNLFSSRTIPKGNIAAFDVDWPSRTELLRGAGSGPAIVLKTRDGQRIQLLATTADPRVKGGPEQLEPSLATLRGWLAVR
jgi:hypothetical protein